MFHDEFGWGEWGVEEQKGNGQSKFTRKTNLFTGAHSGEASATLLHGIHEEIEAAVRSVEVISDDLMSLLCLCKAGESWVAEADQNVSKLEAKEIKLKIYLENVKVTQQSQI